MLVAERDVRWLLGVTACVVLVQAVVVYDSFYLATDDWLLVTFGRSPVDVARLFERQTAGTPAVRPLSLLLARVEHLVAGDAATPRMLLNTLWGATAAWMLFLFLDGLFGPSRRRAAAIASAAFLVWPLQGEALGWYHSGQTMLPVAALSLAALAAFARGWPTFVGLTLLLAALLTRENAVAVGPVVLAIATWRQRSLQAALRSSWPWLLVLGVYVGVRAWQVLSAVTTDVTAQLPIGQSLVSTIGYVAFHLFVPVHPGIPWAWGWFGIALTASLAVVWLGRHELGPAVAWVVVFCLPFVWLYDTGDPVFDVAHASYERRWYHLTLPAAACAWLVATVVSRHRQWLTWALLVGLLALQLVNARWYVGLGQELRVTFSDVEALVATRRPIVLVASSETILSELVEHQMLDIPRVFAGHASPVFRVKAEGDGYVQARLDAFGYPHWHPLPETFVPPRDVLVVEWREAERRLRWVP